MKHAELFALFDALTFINDDFVRRDLGHADEHHRHQADLRIVGFNEQQRARRDLREVTLRFVGAGGVEAGTRYARQRTEALAWLAYISRLCRGFPSVAQDDEAAA